MNTDTHYGENSVVNDLATYFRRIGFHNLAIGDGFNYYLPEDMLVTYAPEWQKHYFDNEFQLRDPIIYHGTTHDMPVVWDELQKSVADTDNKVLNHARDFNMRNGAVIPIKFGNHISIVSFATDGLKPPTDIELECATFVSRLIVRSHLKAKFFQHHEIQLKPDQLAALQILSYGGSRQDVADKLQLQPEGAKSLLDRLYKSLDAKNGNHAVGNAARLGLLH